MFCGIEWWGYCDFVEGWSGVVGRAMIGDLLGCVGVCGVVVGNVGFGIDLLKI